MKKEEIDHAKNLGLNLNSLINDMQMPTTGIELKTKKVGQKTLKDVFSGN